MNTIKREPPNESSVTRWQMLRRQFDDLDGLRQRLDYQTYLLAAAGLVASVLLGLGDLSTRASIAQRQSEDMQATLEQVLPQDLYDNVLQDDVKTVPAQAEPVLGETRVYIARKNGEAMAVAFKLSAAGGYSGPIALMMGIDRQGRIIGVRVIAHAETPGLGDKIERNKSDWILGFEGRSLENTPAERWKVKKDGGEFDQFAGATITPRAVVRGVEAGLGFFRRHREELLAPSNAGGSRHE